LKTKKNHAIRLGKKEGRGMTLTGPKRKMGKDLILLRKTRVGGCFGGEKTPGVLVGTKLKWGIRTGPTANSGREKL